MNVNPNYLFFGGVAIILALVGAAVALTLNGNITGDVCMGFLAGFVAIVTPLISHISGVSQGTAASASGAATVNANPPGA